MEEKKKRSESVGIKDRKKWVCALACLLPADWPEDSSKRVERVDSLRQTRGSKVGRWAVKGSASLAYLKFSLLLHPWSSLPIVRHTRHPVNGTSEWSD